MSAIKGKRKFLIYPKIGTCIVGNDGLTALAIRRMTEMRDNNSTIAFIGPDGQCAAEALVAAAWNLPMITHVRNDSIKYRSFSWPLGGVYHLL
jgi:hypothetical protein